MTEKTVDEIVNEVLSVYSPDDTVHDYENKLRVKLTKTLQAERTKQDEMVESVTHSLLQEIMDDVSILHQRKELDDNGFCTMRDLLHSKAIKNLLDDNN